MGIVTKISKEQITSFKEDFREEILNCIKRSGFAGVKYGNLWFPWLLMIAMVTDGSRLRPDRKKKIGYQKNVLYSKK